MLRGNFFLSFSFIPFYFFHLDIQFVPVQNQARMHAKCWFSGQGPFGVELKKTKIEI
jgi:hypothetical protein